MSEALQGGLFASAAAAPEIGGVVVPYPSVPAAGEVVWRDEAGEVAGTLMRWGVRFAVLRWIPRSTLLQLWREVRGYEPPAGTRACWEGGPAWVDEARRRIGAQRWQQRRKDTYLAVGAEYAASCMEGHPPLTTATQERVAERVGITKRYVSKILRWYQGQGLLGQVLGGTRTKRVEVPAGETDREREARLAAEAAELAARRERIAAAKARWRAGLDHARAELDAVRAGEPIPPAPDGLEVFRRPSEVDDVPVDELELDMVLAVRLATVYELRVPVDPKPSPAPASGGVVVDLRAERDRRRTDSPPAPVDPAEGPAAPAAGTASHRPGGHLSLVPEPTCADVETFLPNTGVQENLSTPDGAGVVDNENRGASRRSDKQSSPVINFRGRKQSTDHRSRAQRAAARLLGRTQDPQTSDVDRLPRRLTWGISVAWLAAQIRPYVDHDWTDAELVAQITTHNGRYPHLPVTIHSRHRFIARALLDADPAIRPAVRTAIAELEADNQRAAQHRQDRIAEQAAARRRERAQARQAAIDACPHCDTEGWTLLDGAGPEVRCDHPTDSPPRPQQPAVPADVSRAAIAAHLAQLRTRRR